MNAESQSDHGSNDFNKQHHRSPSCSCEAGRWLSKNQFVTLDPKQLPEHQFCKNLIIQELKISLR